MAQQNIASRACRLVQLVAAFLAAAPALAQEAQPFPPPGWRPAVIAVATPAAQPIELRDVAITVDVSGGQAQTRIALRLFNPNQRVLEGELQFPLQNGQLVTGFALDVNGRMRDASPVPKAQGQQIFEDIRRRRVDPGLLEQTAGNQYKLRIYPIPAQGERRVLLTIAETLPRQGGAGLLRVPLMFGAAAGQLQMQVNVPGAAPSDVTLLQAPVGMRRKDNPAGVELQFDKSAWSAPQGPAGWLQVAVRQGEGPQVLVGESAGQRFFSARFKVADEKVARPEPRHIALVWDASGSAATQSRVMPVLAAYFGTLRQTTRVSMLVMRNRPEPVRSFSIAPGHFNELAAVLNAEPFDGASNFDELPIPADADVTVMVTDGLMTDGKRLISYRHSAPVLVVNGALTADMPRLQRLAERSGGALVDATRLTTAEAVRAMRLQGWRIESLQSTSARNLVAASAQPEDGRVAIAGELMDSQAQIEVRMAHTDGRHRTLRLNINRQADAGRWPARQWAAWRSQELAENPALHSTELQQIASSHGLTGPNSSLIVLEQAADYARYQLPPPPELAQEVSQLRLSQTTQLARTRQAHIESMVRQFEQRQRWWDKPFAKDEPRPAKQLADRPVAAGSMVSAELARSDALNLRQVAPAAPPPPPMSSPAPAGSSATPVMEAAKKAGRDGGEAPGASIALQAWMPDAPYMRRLAQAATPALYATYLDERRANLASSAFYMDAAGVFFDRGLAALGLRVLSNIAEMNLENRQLLRLYAYRLTQAGRADLAVPVFERISVLAPNEPQSWRDLGLALADTGSAQAAADALWEVVSRQWDLRFSGINMIALAELNAIAAQTPGLDLSRIDRRLRRNLPLALRVVMAWDSDDTDIDMWVTDPNGEKAYYGHQLTYQGGAMSPDATGGYGPEEFAIRSAKPGNYKVEAQFYGERQQILSAGTTVMVRVTTGFGTPQAQDKWTTLRLAAGKEVLKVADIDVR